MVGRMLQRKGNSGEVCIPDTYLELVGLVPGQKVDVRCDQTSKIIIISPIGN